MKTNHQRGFKAKSHTNNAMWSATRVDALSGRSNSVTLGNDFNNGRRGEAKAKRGEEILGLARALSSAGRGSDIVQCISRPLRGVTIEIREFRKLLEAGLRYLNDACSIHELSGRADDCVLAARFWSGHPALRNMAADWATMIDRRWNAWDLLLDPLSENEFRT